MVVSTLGSYEFLFHVTLRPSIIDSLPTSVILLMTFANSLDPDKA